MPDGSSAPASPEEAIAFGELVDARRELADLTRPHRASINFFATEWGFHRTLDEVGTSAGGDELHALVPLAEPSQLKGVTTALTCFESLKDAADAAGRTELFEGDAQRLAQFAENALQNPANWKSEGAARRYCIVRAAAPLTAFGHGDNQELIGNLKEVWDRALPEPSQAGIFEVGEGKQGEDSGLPYPPNAFLTYWALKAIAGTPTLLAQPEMTDKVHIAETWLHSVVGREIALHFENSPARDPQQLVWAICGVLVARNQAIADRAGGTREMVRAGLRAFFEQQVAGTWDRGGALFHYPEAGNAYCYVFETLAELVSLSLDTQNSASAELRQMLRPYLRNLLDAKEYLALSARGLTLDPTDGRVGWSSNHHPHRTAPESWATATAFRFLQATRRLIALEVHERAARQLKARMPQEGLTTMADRGKTWDAGRGSAGALMASLFVHPTLSAPPATSTVDPDRPVLGQAVARSAFLFGPPGTGKTTLAEAVAGALGWQFVEITPADFLDRGSEYVSARADEIFKQLMELDHCVVLFDEIDELIRKRQSAPEALSRFFTTTMLPRLARLWHLKKLIFFVNTNSIRDVDPAVTRSQRFDAAIYVLPPSLDKKIVMLGDAAAYVDAAKVEQVLAHTAAKPAGLTDDEYCMAGIAFLRYDQMEYLQQFPPASADDLRKKIEGFCHELLQSDWAVHSPDNGNHHPPTDPVNVMKTLLDAYESESAFQRIDATKIRVIADQTDGGPQHGLVTHVPGYHLWNANVSLPMGYLDGAAQVKITV